MTLTALLMLSFTLPIAAAAQAPQESHEGMAMHHDKPAAPLSTALTVNIGKGAPVTLTLADLQAMPQQTITVHNEHSKMDETYTGPLVSDVLAKAGLAFTDKTEHPMLRMYLVATGTDRYWVLYSAAEIQPGMHRAQVIVAISKGGQSLGTSGNFQLVDNLDVKPARWVRNLTALTVRTANE